MHIAGTSTSAKIVCHGDGRPVPFMRFQMSDKDRLTYQKWRLVVVLTYGALAMIIWIAAEVGSRNAASKSPSGMHSALAAVARTASR